MRLILIMLLLGSGLSVAANPYTDMSAPELRRAIAAQADVFSENWYQIELIAFARTSSLSGEYWRLDQQPDLNRGALIQLDDELPSVPEHTDDIDREALLEGAWILLNTDNLPLADMAEKMQRAGDRILLHQAWRQPIRERSRAFAILIEAGDVIPELSNELIDEPYNRQPYSEEQNATLSLQLAGMPELEENLSESTVQRQLQGALRFHLSRFLHIEPLLWYSDVSSENQRFWVKIDQQRRMRSDELHYLDHPLFGLLVRITPWQHPEQEKIKDMERALRAKESS